MPRAPVLLLSLLPLAWAGCAPEAPPRTLSPPEERMMRLATPEAAPPIKTPPVKQIDEVNLPDNLPVVGVVADGKARAYSLKALSASDGHVVNDLLGDVPVSVVYCAFHQAVRVYTDARRGKALELAQVGHFGQGLLLRFGAHIYEHKTGRQPGGGAELPLQPLEFEETTWKAWRERHPQTEVYVGPDPLPLGPDKS